jgi:hypothetical protein
MTTDPRLAYRQIMLNAWQAHQAGKALSPLEQQIVAVLQAHPEYQDYFNGLTSQPSLTVNYDLADNPFFHLSLHISVNEQIQLDRPSGIRALYFAACKKTNEHALQHQMMQVLAETLLTAQQNGIAPDERDYLGKLKHLLT